MICQKLSILFRGMMKRRAQAVLFTKVTFDGECEGEKWSKRVARQYKQASIFTLVACIVRK
jgi:hypothetical protein